MRAPRTKFVRGRPVTLPRGMVPDAPPSSSCRSRLRSCGLAVGDVILVHESMDERIWHAETDRGPREVPRKSAVGWSVSQLGYTPPVEPQAAACMSCESPSPVSQMGRCQWCGLTLCRKCIVRDGHDCEGKANT